MTTYKVGKRTYLKTKNRHYLAYKGNLFYYDESNGKYDEVKRPFKEMMRFYLQILTES